jgi:hypothetical protein
MPAQIVFVRLVEFSVSGGSKGIRVFKTGEEADAHAGQLQGATLGGEAKIILHDLKREAERSWTPDSIARN